MTHVDEFRIEVSRVGDRFVAEIERIGNRDLETVLSPLMRGNLAVTDDAARHFALKHFCAEIGDTLRAFLESI